MDQFTHHESANLIPQPVSQNSAGQLTDIIPQQTSSTAIHFHHSGARAFFSLQETQQILPIIFKLTKKYSEEVTALMDRLNAIGSEMPGLEDKIEVQVNALIQSWQNKMTKLGALPKGLWLLDFDSGDGYFCWKFPERQIQFWHHYQDGFSKRLPVDSRLESLV
jgi:hypothetical protein